MTTKEKSPTKKIAEKTIYATFQILKKYGPLRGKDVINKIRETVTFDDYESHVYEKTGYVRWESILHFYTIDSMKAGFLRKENGLWILTEEGEKAINLGQEKLLETANTKYGDWKNGLQPNEKIVPDKIIEEQIVENQQVILSQIIEKAAEGIRDFVIKKSPYEFQQMVSYLLSAMGYFISHVADKGPDGGIDIIAYRDPLGTVEPRLIIQVKHRPDDKVPAEDIQKLVGTMKRDKDVGLFVTSGQFSKPAMNEARTTYKHIELIDFGRFVSLWQEHFAKMTDEQKNALPLKAIYFLGSNE